MPSTERAADCAAGHRPDAADDGQRVIQASSPAPPEGHWDGDKGHIGRFESDCMEAASNRVPELDAQIERQPARIGVFGFEDGGSEQAAPRTEPNGLAPREPCAATRGTRRIAPRDLVWTDRRGTTRAVRRIGVGAPVGIGGADRPRRRDQAKERAFEREAGRRHRTAVSTGLGPDPPNGLCVHHVHPFGRLGGRFSGSGRSIGRSLSAPRGPGEQGFAGFECHRASVSGG